MKKYFFAIYVGFGWAASLYYLLMYGENLITPIFWMLVIFLVIVPLIVFYEYRGGEGSGKKNADPGIGDGA